MLDHYAAMVEAGEDVPELRERPPVWADVASVWTVWRIANRGRRDDLDPLKARDIVPLLDTMGVEQGDHLWYLDHVTCMDVEFRRFQRDRREEEARHG
ncbi:MAG: hypothetical protein GY716_15735 [bacterium]|nr:hypothetical protein [bacterium]